MEAKEKKVEIKAWMILAGQENSSGELGSICDPP